MGIRPRKGGHRLRSESPEGRGLSSTEPVFSRFQPIMPSFRPVGQNALCCTERTHVIARAGLVLLPPVPTRALETGGIVPGRLHVDGGERVAMCLAEIRGRTGWVRR